MYAYLSMCHLWLQHVPRPLLSPSAALWLFVDLRLARQARLHRHIPMPSLKLLGVLNSAIRGQGLAFGLWRRLRPRHYCITAFPCTPMKESAAPFLGQAPCQTSRTIAVGTKKIDTKAGILMSFCVCAICFAGMEKITTGPINIGGSGTLCQIWKNSFLRSSHGVRGQEAGILSSACTKSTPHLLRPDAESMISSLKVSDLYTRGGSITSAYCNLFSLHNPIAERGRTPPPKGFLILDGTWCRPASVFELNRIYEAVRQRRIAVMMASRFTRTYHVTIRPAFLNDEYVLTYGPLPFIAPRAD